LKIYVRYIVLLQKGNKDIIKVVHVTSVGELECFEASKIHFGPQKKKQNKIKYNKSLDLR